LFAYLLEKDHLMLAYLLEKERLFAVQLSELLAECAHFRGQRCLAPLELGDVDLKRCNMKRVGFTVGLF
jgi:hypothetical protein